MMDHAIRSRTRGNYFYDYRFSPLDAIASFCVIYRHTARFSGYLLVQGIWAQNRRPARAIWN